MKHFFISYNSNDRTWAEWIAWQLETRNTEGRNSRKSHSRMAASQVEMEQWVSP